MGDELKIDRSYIPKYRYEPIDIGLSFSVNNNSENASRVFNEASDNIGPKYRVAPDWRYAFLHCAVRKSPGPAERADKDTFADLSAGPPMWI